MTIGILLLPILNLHMWFEYYGHFKQDLLTQEHGTLFQSLVSSTVSSVPACH